MALVFSNGALGQLYGSSFNSISSLKIDLTIRETHRLSNSLTRRAVEGGATITDNILIIPDSVTMSCIVKSDQLGTTWQEKLEKIKQLRQAREPFDIVTSAGVYESMFFDGSIVINRDVSNNTVLAFSATFSKILIIDSISTAVPKSASKDPQRTAPGEDVGKKQSQENTEPVETKKQSILYGLLN